MKAKIFFLNIALSILLIGLFGTISLQAQKLYPVNVNTPVRGGSILHAWCWSFNTIKENMAEIAASGYVAVQTSPPNECLVGENGGMQILGDGKWYYHYQPTDWKIGNYHLGNRNEFIAMCDEARKYDITVIADVLPNHTTSNREKVSESLNNAVGGQENLYHENGLNTIRDYSDRFQCTTGALGRLPDVNTENPDFQVYYMDYVNDLIACGVRGFRYDTGKHIGLPDDPKDPRSAENNFWPIFAIGEEIRGKNMQKADSLFIYAEVLQGKNSREGTYAEFADVVGCHYGSSVRKGLEENEFDVDMVSDWRNDAHPKQLVTWVESHDTYCNRGESAGLTDTQIKLGWALIGTRKWGTPLFYSRPAGSGPGNRWGNNLIGERGNDTFKDPLVVAVNKFRIAMKDVDEKLSNPNNIKSILQIEREDKGLCIINLENKQMIKSSVALPDGNYTNQVNGKKYKVRKGVLKASLPAQSAVILM